MSRLRGRSIPWTGMVVASFPGYGFNFIFVFSMARRARINAPCILILCEKIPQEGGCWIAYVAFLSIFWRFRAIFDIEDKTEWEKAGHFKYTFAVTGKNLLTCSSRWELKQKYFYWFKKWDLNFILCICTYLLEYLTNLQGFYLKFVKCADPDSKINPENLGINCLSRIICVYFIIYPGAI